MADGTWYWGYSQAITTDTINPNYLNNPIIAVSDKGYTSEDGHVEGYVYVYAMDNNGNLNILGRDDDVNGSIAPNKTQAFPYSNQNFGYSIDIACMSDGYYLFVSSPYADTEKTETGRVDVYYLSYDTDKDEYGEWEWKSHTKSNVKNDAYGYSISVAVISDTEIRIAIGCPRHSDYVRTYDYEINDNEWNNKINLETDQSSDVRFGESVSLNAKDGTILAVGAPEQDSNSGVVYIYTYSPASSSSDGGWLDHVTITYSSTDSYIGKTVSLNYAGDYLAVGSEPDSGSIIYLHHNSGSEWTLVEEKSSTTNTRSKVKLSRDENSQLLVVGTPDVNSNKGLITIYKYTSY